MLARKAVTTWTPDRLLDELRDAIMVTEATPIDGPGPRIVYANKAFERVTGYAADEVVGRSFLFLQGAGTKADVRPLMRKALVQRTPVRVDLINHRKDGEPFWSELEIVPLVDAASNVVTHFMSLLRDVTAVPGGRNLLSRYAAMLDEAPGAISLRGLDDVVVYWNRTAERLYGWSAAEAVGRHISDLLGIDRSEIEAARRATLATGRWTGRFSHTRRDGTTIVLRADWSLITPAEGLEPAIVSICTDITDQVRVQERVGQAERLEALGQLTGGIAHDFNNLLTILIGSTDIALRRAADRPDILPLLEMTRSAADRGANLVSRLLAFARRQPLAPAPTDVGCLVADMEAMLHRTLGGNIVIERIPADDLWLAQVDAAQLESAILNLCLNARDAMQPVGGRIIVETANVHLDADYACRIGDVAPGSYVMVAITDTGSGMTEETLDHIFEPFFTTKAGGGSGLGLSMVHGFVKQSGGHIVVYSEESLGTTVRLYLPRSASMPLEYDDAIMDAVGGTESILLVEDDDLVRRHAANLLTDLGYTVVVAENGRTALQILENRSEQIELVFTDMVMPGGMDGLQLGNEVRRTYPHIAVLYTSGFTDHAMDLRGPLGNAPFLRKPYRVAELASKIRAALARDQRPQVTP